MSHYDTLGVDPKATLQQIKEAYRDKALRFHPDINPGADQDAGKFQEVSNAYEVSCRYERQRDPIFCCIPLNWDPACIMPFLSNILVYHC